MMEGYFQGDLLTNRYSLIHLFNQYFMNIKKFMKFSLNVQHFLLL